MECYACDCRFSYTFIKKLQSLFIWSFSLEMVSRGLSRIFSFPKNLYTISQNVRLPVVFFFDSWCTGPCSSQWWWLALRLEKHRNYLLVKSVQRYSLSLLLKENLSKLKPWIFWETETLSEILFLTFPRVSY